MVRRILVTVSHACADNFDPHTGPQQAHAASKAPQPASLSFDTPAQSSRAVGSQSTNVSSPLAAFSGTVVLTFSFQNNMLIFIKYSHLDTQSQQPIPFPLGFLPSTGWGQAGAGTDSLDWLRITSEIFTQNDPLDASVASVAAGTTQSTGKSATTKTGSRFQFVKDDEEPQSSVPPLMTQAPSFSTAQQPKFPSQLPRPSQEHQHVPISQTQPNMVNTLPPGFMPNYGPPPGWSTPFNVVPPAALFNQNPNFSNSSGGTGQLPTGTPIFPFGVPILAPPPAALMTDPNIWRVRSFTHMLAMQPNTLQPHPYRKCPVRNL